MSRSWDLLAVFMRSTRGIPPHDCPWNIQQNLKFKSLTLSRTKSSFYSCTTIKLIQMEYQVTYIFPTFYQLTMNDWPLSGKCSMRGEVLKKGIGWVGKKKKTLDFLRCLLRSVCDWQSPSPFSWKPCDPSKNSKAPRSAGNKMISGRFCHGLPFISCDFSFRVWPLL